MGNIIISGTLQEKNNEKLINMIVDELKTKKDTPIYVYAIGNETDKSILIKIINVLSGKNYLNNELIEKKDFINLHSEYKLEERLNIIVFNHNKVVERTSLYRRPKFDIVQEENAIIFGYDIYIEAIVHSILVSKPTAVITVNPLSGHFYSEEKLKEFYRIDEFIDLNN